MTRDHAQRLLLLYSMAFAADEETEDEDTLAGLHRRWTELDPPGSDAKLMRWLGFAQGSAYALDLYTLWELKAHSKGDSLP